MKNPKPRITLQYIHNYLTEDLWLSFNNSWNGGSHINRYFRIKDNWEISKNNLNISIQNTTKKNLQNEINLIVISQNISKFMHNGDATKYLDYKNAILESISWKKWSF